jgi:hypothetical protein
MKAYLLTVLINDHDNLGAEGIEEVLSNARYPNHCINPIVIKVKEAEIGEWHDDHPLNGGDNLEEIKRLFSDD